MLRDFVLWDFVSWDFVHTDFVLWDFVLCDSVPDSLVRPKVRRAVPLRSDSIRLHIVRAIRADIDINHNSIIIFEQFSTPPCIRWSVRLYAAQLRNICHIFLLCYVSFGSFLYKFLYKTKTVQHMFYM